MKMQYPQEFLDWFISSRVSYRGDKAQYATNKLNCFSAWKAGRSYEKRQKYVEWGKTQMNLSK
jgi:hypothetical protein